MQIDLTPVVIESPDFRIPREHMEGRSLYSKYEHSSGSYSAFRCEDAKFKIRRLQTLSLPEVDLGKCGTEERARKILDWWVANDRRLIRIILDEIRGRTPQEDLVDLICEAAHACRSSDH